MTVIQSSGNVLDLLLLVIERFKGFSGTIQLCESGDGGCELDLFFKVILLSNSKSGVISGNVSFNSYDNNVG